MLPILQYAALALTALTGVLGFFMPRAITGFIGLSAPGARGISELRGIFGGLFIALGLAPFLLGAPAMQLVGWSYAGIAITRGVSVIIDRSFERSNLISLAIEIACAVVLLA